LRVELPGGLCRNLRLREVVKTAWAVWRRIEINHFGRNRIDFGRRNHVAGKGSSRIVDDCPSRILDRSQTGRIEDVDRLSIDVKALGEIARSLQCCRHCPIEGCCTLEMDPVIGKKEKSLILFDRPSHRSAVLIAGIAGGFWNPS